ncbi:hypothetical protein ACFQW6_10415 [Nocardioides sp. GCM10028917]|uniref:hypothetical protein n=1 Tax=Nocardioides sp. GCM10028917 TaxID=3273408 RepID=UPI00361DA7B2
MLILLATPVIAAVAFVQRILKAVAPSNVLITRVRRAGPSCRGGATLAVLALLLLMAFRVLTLAISTGAPGWLNLLVLVLAWDTIKFAVASCLEAFGYKRAAGGANPR